MRIGDVYNCKIKNTHTHENKQKQKSINEWGKKTNLIYKSSTKYDNVYLMSIKKKTSERQKKT